MSVAKGEGSGIRNHPRTDICLSFGVHVARIGFLFLQELSTSHESKTINPANPKP